MTHRRPGIVIFALALFAFSPKAEAASLPERVVIAHASLGVRVAPLWVAQEQGFLAKYGVASELVWVRGGSLLVAGDQGFFSKHGLDVRLVRVSSGPVGLSAIVSGDSHFYHGPSTGATLGAIAGGLDAVFVAGLINKLNGAFVVEPSIRKPSELKGKTIGVQSIGEGAWMITMLVLNHWELDPKGRRLGE